MKLERYHNNIRYTISNDGLKVNDKVFPIARGRCLDNNDWILQELDYETSGFPDEPHTIKNLNYSDYKPYQIETDRGFGPIEKYYKIIKKEQFQQDHSKKLRAFHWVEIV